MDPGFDSAAAALRNDQTSHRRSAWRRGEAQPAPQAGSTHMTFAAGATCSIEDAGAFVVHCAHGTLWVTSPTLGCDLILSGGERLQVSTRGKLLVAAMVDSAMWLPPGYGLEDGNGRPTTPRIVRRPQ
jgi:hypothetical protein